MVDETTDDISSVYRTEGEMSHEEHETTEQLDHRGPGTAFWAAVAIVGAAAAAFFIARKFVKGEKFMDVDSLLDAADRAANRLDAILSQESTQAVS